MPVKYKQYFTQMSEENQELFNQFDEIHAGYKADRKAWSKKFHEVGGKVVEIMKDWERKLCSGMERGANAVYSAKLADKYWDEIKKRYSHIELVGVKSNLD